MADSDFDNDDVQDSRRVAAAKANLNPKLQTVKDPQRMAFPGIYGNPKEIAAKAASRVAPEDPALKQLFGVTRGDLYEMGQGRKGNLPGTLPGAAAKPKGAAAAARVMTKENEQRLLDTLGEAQKHESLRHGMEPWYITDPAFQRMAQLIGMEAAVREYDKLNHLIGMASPASEVMTEIPRGTAAYALDTQGRFKDFLKYAGMPEGKRTRRFPADIRNVPGHAYHKTAQAGPMAKYLESGEMTMKTPKVPLYIQASGVPETGFQTATPVGDAHWSRAVGLADTRNWKTVKGKQAIPGASVTNPEMAMLSPWWRNQIAGKLGIESVPAQALAWGTFAPQTGVDTPIGAGKLELLAKNIMMTAHRLGVSPETARDMILMGKTYAGKAEGGTVGYAEGGEVKAEPTQDEMLAHVMLNRVANLKDVTSLKNVGVNEAPNLKVKEYVAPGTGPGLPVGGVDFQPEMPGQQILPGQPAAPMGAMPPQPGQPAGQMPPTGQPPTPAPGAPRSNILQMTPQGQAMAAMRPNQPMPRMADGGSTTPSVEDMKQVLSARERDANLAKFLKGSKVPERVYRGSSRVEDQKQIGNWFTSNPSNASEFAKDKSTEDYEPGAVVGAYHIALKNPLIIDAKGSDYNDLPAQKISKKHPYLKIPKNLDEITTDELVHFVKKLNKHDGVIFKNVNESDAVVDAQPATTYVAFHPHQVKSAIGNQGTYDTSNPDITKKEGGTVKDYIRITERPL
jgi:hypothetical protein